LKGFHPAHPENPDAVAFLCGSISSVPDFGGDPIAKVARNATSADERHRDQSS
jgi:hypothetical protein